jgi:MFS family permease
LDVLNVFKPLRTLTFPHIQDKSARRTAIFVVTTKFVILITLLFASAPLDLLMEMIYQWRASELGVVMTLSSVASAVSLTVVVPVGLYVFGKLYKTSSTEIDKIDIRLIQFCATTVLLGSAMMAFAENSVVFLVGNCIIQMSVTVSPIILSVMVKYAEKKHIGLVFGAMNQVAQVSSIIATSAGLSIFQRFINTDPRITLHISTTVMGLFFILLVAVLK